MSVLLKKVTSSPKKIVSSVEVRNDSRLLSERRSVREYEEQYGILRAQALTPCESLGLLEKMLGEL
ncbi:hypothetical protein [Streptomyces hirsutus]|uniref:hypothetical protein n=1 Tax=Streptomyces hirsutus TaxID=35620 RepID=UPI0006E1B8D2|nr:hypothetical protein [Streptomyces hirsutus]